MQFLTFTAAIIVFTAGAMADLHTNAICVNTSTAYSVYNAAATESACREYLNRNTGTEQWDTCPDCKIVATGTPHCESLAQHIGGDEITAYCKQAGADNALTS